MHRLVGAVLIILAGSMLGFLKSDSLKKRVDGIGKIITGLGLLQTDISYGRKNLKSALQSIGEHQEIDLFKRIAKEIDKNGIREAVSIALSEDGQYLLEKDKVPVLALAENLGMTDCGNQEIAIKRAMASLDEAKADAEAQYERLGRLYLSSGVLGGILVAIILI